MNFTFAGMRWIGAGLLVLVVAGVGVAQQGFPLRPGDWESTTKSEGSGEPTIVHFCLNNETWIKALTQVPACTIRQLTATSKGVSYSMDCSMKNLEMKSQVIFTYDGLEHMTGKASVAATSSGKTTNSQSLTEYRWKGATCTSADVNLKKKTP
jgi:hypothetical protein